MYALILAGGSGTRLWPHSRGSRPKQFLNIGGETSMLQQTVARILPLIPPERILIATGALYAGLVAEQLPEVPRANIIAEPMGRGTGPCIGLAALQLRRRDPEAVMVVLSADHRIEREEQFRATLAAAGRAAREGHLVTLGITPTEPSTGYGYIRCGEALEPVDGQAVFRVQGFTEKPDRATAQAYLAGGDYLWNAGMFVWKVSRVLEELEQHEPALFQGLEAIDQAPDRLTQLALLDEIWPQLPTVAIDVAVMERTAQGAVLPVDIGWSDIGDWAALADTMPRDADGNAVVGTYMGLDTRNTLVYGNGRMVATIGVEDLMIIDTHDVLLICPRHRAQDVKAMVERLRDQHRNLV